MTEIVEALKTPLDDKLVSRRTQGKDTMLYLEGFQVINQANRIFGYLGWDSHTIEVKEVRSIAVPKMVWDDTTRKKVPQGTTFRTVYQAIVEVTVYYQDDAGNRLSVTRTGVGTASSAEDTPDSVEMAIKGAETDAEKRAFRQFGEQFGNSLYDKKSEENAAMKAGRSPRASTKAVPAKADAPSATCDLCANRVVPAYSEAHRRTISVEEQLGLAARFGHKALCKDHLVEKARA